MELKIVNRVTTAAMGGRIAAANSNSGIGYLCRRQKLQHRMDGARFYVPLDTI